LNYSCAGDFAKRSDRILQEDFIPLDDNAIGELPRQRPPFISKPHFAFLGKCVQSGHFKNSWITAYFTGRKAKTEEIPERVSSNCGSEVSDIVNTKVEEIPSFILRYNEFILLNQVIKPTTNAYIYYPIIPGDHHPSILEKYFLNFAEPSSQRC